MKPPKNFGVHSDLAKKKVQECLAETFFSIPYPPGRGHGRPLRRALDQAAKSPTFTIIEVMIGPRDLSPISVKYIRTSVKKAQLKTRI